MEWLDPGHCGNLETEKQMKTMLKAFTGLLLAVGLATTASAQRANNALPFPKSPLKSASSQEEIQKMKKGNRYMQVCMECQSVTVKEVADDKEVEALCHDGGPIHCPSCKKKVKVKRVGPPGKGTAPRTKREIIYVNEEGKECMFIVPIKEE
jgi:hypothetical protein